MTARRNWSERANRIGMRLLKIGVVSTLTLILAAECFSAIPGESPPFFRLQGWFQAALAVFAILTYTLYRPGRKRWIGYVAVLSITLSLLEIPSDERGIGVTELFAMGILMLYAVRQWDAPPGRWVAPALGTAILLIGFRLFKYTDSAVGGTMMILFALGSVVGFGAYLRGLDKLRRETQEEVRRAERLELAREMHDFVAHHVTGMVVLAQAAQVTDSNPQKWFADIEEAGLAALASMRRMVKMLRAEDAGTGVNPLGDLSQIDDLVERFSREGTDASCFISPDLVGRIDPEIAATAHRVVREALTNIRKHARGAGQVRVVVAAAGSQGLEVAVRDDGRAARKKLADTGGGIGLVGLNERVQTVGGSLRAEPRPEGGWEVTAWLPVAAAVPE